MSLHDHGGSAMMMFAFVAGMATASLCFYTVHGIGGSRSSSSSSSGGSPDGCETSSGQPGDVKPAADIAAAATNTSSKNVNNSSSSCTTQGKRTVLGARGESLMNLFQGSSGKGRWPWESRAKNSSRSSSTESESSASSSSASSNGRSPPRITSRNDEPPPPDNKSSTATATTRRNTTSMAQSKQGNLCIGSIFGLDVGGTLAKLVYFEAEDPTSSSTCGSGSGYAAAAASLRSPAGVSPPAPSSSATTAESINNNTVQSSADDETVGPERYVLLQKRASMTKVSRKDWKPIPVAQDHYQLYLHHPHTHSVPSNLNTLGDHHDDDDGQHHPGLSTYHPIPPAVLPPLLTRSSSFHDLLEPPLPLPSPWDGQYDRHHTATATTTMSGEDHRQYRQREALSRFYAVAKTLAAAHDDVSTSFYSSELGGTFHFIRFETKHMADAMHLIRHYNLHLNIQEMGGTGGGAHKYADLLRDELAITMKKQDELDSLVAGMQFVLNTVVGECYTYRPRHHDDNDHHPTTQKQNDVADWSPKVVQRHEESSLYPYLVVMVGTGVSVLRVDGPRQYERVSGSTIGGGTFFGLIRLLTDADKFDDGTCSLLLFRCFLPLLRRSQVQS
jgi:Fumble